MNNNNRMNNGTNARVIRRRTHYRIKSPMRFITFLVITVCMIMAGVGFATGAYVSTASVVDEYTTYTVGDGDTLWSIADRYRGERTDVRKAVYVISQVNDIHADELYPGTELLIPTDLQEALRRDQPYCGMTHSLRRDQPYCSMTHSLRVDQPQYDMADPRRGKAYTNLNINLGRIKLP